MAGVDAERDAIRRWFDAALGVVDPRQAVRASLAMEDGDLVTGDARVRLAPDARLVVLSIGKAAGGMALGARDVLGDRIDHGIILTKYGHLGEPIAGFDAYEANHPTPDQAGLEATSAILDAVRLLGAGDVVVALISGGGSALLELPGEGLSLEDVQDVTRRLMHAGAGIHDLNLVRKALSQVKGGGLRRAIGSASCVTLLLSDVLGNDPETIASGPTVLPERGAGDAGAVLERFGILADVPDAVRRALSSATEEAPPVDTTADVVKVVADNAMFVTEMARQATADGLISEQMAEPYEGEARELGEIIVKLASGTPHDVDVLFRGGEATVAVTGDGVGGRNTEMALAAARVIDGRDDWVIASLASDGDDGNSGSAGAIADGGTLSRAREAGADPDEALRDNDSAAVFRAAGGLVETGPTGTNVNDVYVALRVGRIAERRGLE